MRSVTAVPWLPSLVEGAGVDHWLRGLLAAQDDEQVGNHRGLALLIKLDDVVEPLPPGSIWRPNSPMIRKMHGMIFATGDSATRVRPGRPDELA